MMGLENFGTLSFTSETKAADFIRYLEEGEVKTTRCRKCGKTYFPPRMDCGTCSSSEMEWIEINDLGELLAFSTIMYGPTGFENEVPYTIAVIRLPNGVQIFGRISRKVPLGEIKVGMKLKVSPIKMSSGRVSFEFQPSDQ